MADSNSETWPDFVWSVGEEGSDPVVLMDGKPHRHDQYAQSGHYANMTQDLRAIANLGVSIVRYGMPWRLTEREAGAYDWSLWDRALSACDDVGLTSVVDLLHFGLPDHYPGLADPQWIEGFARYVDAFLARYPEPMWFTPVNEPGITATMTARWGLWNDCLRSPADHARVLSNVVLANLEAIARVQADRNGWWISSEGFDVHVDPVDNRNGTVKGVADRRRAISWLPWDLHFGLEPLAEARNYLEPVDDRVLDRISALAVKDRLIAGHDFYPTSIQATNRANPGWTITERISLGMQELTRWYERYQQPLWISETSNLSLPLADQIPWLNAMTQGLTSLRGNGVPVRGLCWYSRGDQYDWQTGLVNPSGAVTEVGLFDTERSARPCADRFAELVRTSSTVLSTESGDHDAHS
jgi:beta-glucosidase/6-phospho-beta-glucosidase/beta-galactosidase